MFHPGHAEDLQFAIARQLAPQRIGNLTKLHKTSFIKPATTSVPQVA
jgi:hypothetical protein